MFVIVGNDITNNKVHIFDTDDGTTSSVSHAVLYKAITDGIEVKGIDERGNIVCQEDDLTKEMTKVLSPLVAKILLLQLKMEKVYELFYLTLKPYGFVDKITHILFPFLIVVIIS